MRFFTLLFVLLPILGFSQEDRFQDPFKQLYRELPTPNSYRTASGAPGHEYWQQKADYIIDVVLDEEKQKISGKETITYHNNSPDYLEYLWLQLDQNMRAKDSDRSLIQQDKLSSRERYRNLISPASQFDGGFKITTVTDDAGNALPYVINKTMMRIDLPEPLSPGEKVSFNIEWWYNINNRLEIGGRSGYEYFEDEDNYIFTIAQFYPRMCVYIDNEGWQNKQFLGRGEFTLTFGDFQVAITAPEDHLIAATGTLENIRDILPDNKIDLLNKAKDSYEQPVIIYSEDEARKREKRKANGIKTWTFKADNVRDFAFASSRKFIWDAMAVKLPSGKETMAMSMYPKEGNPLWEKYSTKVVAHTLKWYSHYTVEYPYPVCWSVHTDRIGMEYPMISFNGGRPEKDGTYSERTKYGLIGVIIHEVGHNFFPMIINSDERQWTWMDEGLTTFVQFLTEQQWERDYPSRRGPAENIVPYMSSDKSKIAPIMTNSESLVQFGNNAYAKPATALNILRETVMGRELFDHAFKTYCERWKFKHPSPADFFRTMEDASGVDLDWFWRGWFFSTDHVDQAISNIKEMTIDPKAIVARQKTERLYRSEGISTIRNREEMDQTYSEKDPSVLDFYNSYDPEQEDQIDKEVYQKYMDQLTEEEKELLKKEKYFYQIDIENSGGLVMPVIIKMTYEDGMDSILRIPAEIWRFDDPVVNKVIPSDKRIVQFELDPFLEIADINRENNFYPPKPVMTRFELFKSRQSDNENPMQRARKQNGKVIKP